MDLRKLGMVAAVGVLAAVPGVANGASGGTARDSATGGGQAFLNGEDPAGAGDTIAFQAQRAKDAPTTSDAATGQLQVNRRTTSVVKFHGNISCLVVTSNGDTGTAYMSGMSRATKTTTAQPFELYVYDGGKGTDERGMDMINLYYGAETDQGSSDDNGPCGLPSEPDSFDLARGNVQVRNRSTAEDGKASQKSSAAAPASTGSPTSLLGL